jgi:hypothetical protein
LQNLDYQTPPLLNPYLPSPFLPLSLAPSLFPNLPAPAPSLSLVAGPRRKSNSEPRLVQSTAEELARALSIRQHQKGGTVRYLTLLPETSEEICECNCLFSSSSDPESPQPTSSPSFCTPIAALLPLCLHIHQPLPSLQLPLLKKKPSFRTSLPTSLKTHLLQPKLPSHHSPLHSLPDNSLSLPLPLHLSTHSLYNHHNYNSISLSRHHHAI